MGKNKKLAFGAQPSNDRKPRIEADPNDFARQCLSWRLGMLQLDGPWNWTVHPDTLRRVLEKLRDLERTNWVEVGRGGSHQIERDKLCRDAQRRLEELNLDDVEELYSLRLTGRERVWGIRELHVLKLLWWDPEHEVCPSYKKNT